MSWCKELNWTVMMSYSIMVTFGLEIFLKKKTKSNTKKENFGGKIKRQNSTVFDMKSNINCYGYGSD